MTFWIKRDKALTSKPEVLQIATRLKIDRWSAAGRCEDVWCWFDEHSTDGFVEVPKSFIDELVSCEGFADAMQSVGWLSSDNGSVCVPKFDRHMGQSAKRRADDADRQRRSRKSRRSLDGRTIPAAVRRTVLSRDCHTCVYCGRRDGEYSPTETVRDSVMSIDHVIPWSDGGATDETNLVACCGPCNNKKNNRLPEDAGFDWPVKAIGPRPKNVTAKRDSDVTPSFSDSESVSVPNSSDVARANAIAALARAVGHAITSSNEYQLQQYVGTLPASVVIHDEPHSPWELVARALSAAAEHADCKTASQAVKYITTVCERCIRDECWPGEFDRNGKPKVKEPARLMGWEN